MNAHARMVNALQRIAAASSVARSRTDEAERATRRGDSGIADRLDSIVSRFEKLADEMEAALS